MANPGYNEEQSLVKHKDNVTGLVDYSSSSEDDNHEPALKKQCLTGSKSGSELINHASEDDNHKLPSKKQHLSESNSKPDSDIEDDQGSHFYTTKMTKEYMRKAYLDMVAYTSCDDHYEFDDEDDEDDWKYFETDNDNMTL